MSGVFRAVGRIAGTIAAVAAFIPGGQPIAAIAAGVAAVSNVGAALTAKKPPLLGSVSNLTIGADQATPMWLGDTYGGGALVSQNGFGAPINDVPNPYLAMTVIYSAGGPIAGFDTDYADFAPVTFSGSGEATGYFSQILFRKTQLGATPESAALTAQWAGEPDWGSSYKLSGYAAGKYSLKWDSKNGKYNSGAPQLGKRGRGVRTWDPRLDSTWPGGSGSHRWVDPRANPASFAAAKGTWSYSDRPGLHALRYALGTWERNPAAASTAPWILTYGVGIPIDGIVVEDFIELENICEANGWEISATLLEPGDKWANLKRILAAGGARPCFKGGKLGLKLTAPRIALDTITRDDLADHPLSAAGAQPRTDRLNTVIPKFRSPAHKWELQQSDEIVVTDYLAIDGEEKRSEQVFEFVKSPTQAARLAAYALFDSREQGPIELHCKPRLRRYAGGDMLELSDEVRDDLGLELNNVVVLYRSIDPVTMTVTLTLVTENLLKHILAMAVTGTAPAAITLPTTEQLDRNSGVSDVLNQIEALADDGVLSRFEKITKLIPLNTRLADLWALLDLQADTLSAFPSVVSAQALAAAKYAAWTSYRGSLSPAWNDTGTDTPVVRAAFDGVVAALSAALDELARAIREAVLSGQGTTTLINQANMSIVGGTVTKTGGASSGWDASVHSAESYAGDVIAMGQVTSIATHVMIGLNSDPTGGADYTNIDFAAYASVGSFSVYEGGTGVFTGGTVAVGNFIYARRRGTTIEYGVLGEAAPRYTRTGVSATTNLYLDTSFYEVGAQLKSVQLMPLGKDGADGKSAVAGLLTNESHVLQAAANGTIISYAGASGNFVVFSGATDVSSSFTLSTKAGGNPQGLTVNYSGRTYTVTAGLDAGEASAKLVIVATGSGAFAGVTVEKEFSLSKSVAGGDGVSPPLIYVSSTHQTFRYDKTGAPLAQTTTVTANRQNTTDATRWRVYKADGTLIVGYTSAAALAAAMGNGATSPDNDTLVFPQNSFQANIAYHSTTGLIFETSLTGLPGILDKISIVKVQDGTDGTDGDDGVSALSVSALPGLSVSVPCTAGGTPKAALPSVQLKVTQASSDVTGSASYTVTGSSNVSSPAVSSGGVVSVTGMGAAVAGTVQVTISRGGATYIATITYTKVLDGPAFVYGSASVGAPSSTSYQTVATLSLLMGPNGTISLDSNGGFGSASGVINVQGTIDYSLTGGSSWTTAVSIAGNQGDPSNGNSGDWSADALLSGATIGLTTKQTVMFRVTMRKTNTNSFSSFSGSLNANWVG